MVRPVAGGTLGPCLNAVTGRAPLPPWPSGWPSVLLVVACARPAGAAADPVLGFADDGTLVTNPAAPDRVFASAGGHGARFVRLIAYMNRYPHDKRYLDVARQADCPATSGSTSRSRSPRSASVTPPEFAAWAARITARLAAVASPVRVSILNEPDLLLEASDDCDPTSAFVTVREAGYVPTKALVRVAVRRSRIARRVIRRHGRRRHVRRKLVWTVHRWSTRLTLGSTGRSVSGSTLTRRPGLPLDPARADRGDVPRTPPCRRSERPRPASRSVPVRRRRARASRCSSASSRASASHPSTAGRTIPTRSSTGAGSTPREEWFGFDRLVEYAGARPPAVRPRDAARPDRVRRQARPYARPARSGVRLARGLRKCLRGRARDSIVAYQWTPTPADQHRSWDTSVMGDDLTETPESTQLPTLRC